MNLGPGLQNGHMPPEIAAALAAAPPQMQQQQPKVPPVDLGNPNLAPVEVDMDLRVDDVEEGFQDVPAGAMAVPAEVRTGDGEQTKVVIFTIRSVCQTFTAFWDREKTRANIEWIRRVIDQMMPVVVLPPGLVAPPSTRRMFLSLTHEATDSSIEVTLDSTHAVEWADLLERALLALSGLELP
jgi:hypothetical protein